MMNKEFTTCPNCSKELVEESKIGIFEKRFVVEFNAHCRNCYFRFSWNEDREIFLGGNVREENSASSVPDSGVDRSK